MSKKHPVVVEEARVARVTVVAPEGVEAPTKMTAAAEAVAVTVIVAVRIE